jgi:hypothetical protein
MLCFEGRNGRTDAVFLDEYPRVTYCGPTSCFQLDWASAVRSLWNGPDVLFFLYAPTVTPWERMLTASPSIAAARVVSACTPAEVNQGCGD